MNSFGRRIDPSCGTVRVGGAVPRIHSSALLQGVDAEEDGQDKQVVKPKRAVNKGETKHADETRKDSTKTPKYDIQKTKERALGRLHQTLRESQARKQEKQQLINSRTMKISALQHRVREWNLKYLGKSSGSDPAVPVHNSKQRLTSDVHQKKPPVPRFSKQRRQKENTPRRQKENTPHPEARPRVPVQFIPARKKPRKKSYTASESRNIVKPRRETSDRADIDKFIKRRRADRIKWERKEQLERLSQKQRREKLLDQLERERCQSVNSSRQKRHGKTLSTSSKQDVERCSTNELKVGTLLITSSGSSQSRAINDLKGDAYPELGDISTLMKRHQIMGGSVPTILDQEAFNVVQGEKVGPESHESGETSFDDSSSSCSSSCSSGDLDDEILETVQAVAKKTAKLMVQDATKKLELKTRSVDDQLAGRRTKIWKEAANVNDRMQLLRTQNISNSNLPGAKGACTNVTLHNSGPPLSPPSARSCNNFAQIAEGADPVEILRRDAERIAADMLNQAIARDPYLQTHCKPVSEMDFPSRRQEIFEQPKRVMNHLKMYGSSDKYGVIDRFVSTVTAKEKERLREHRESQQMEQEETSQRADSALNLNESNNETDGVLSETSYSDEEFEQEEEALIVDDNTVEANNLDAVAEKLQPDGGFKDDEEEQKEENGETKWDHLLLKVPHEDTRPIVETVNPEDTLKKIAASPKERGSPDSKYTSHDTSKSPERERNLSPGSLRRKLLAQVNLLESLEQTHLQLNEVEHSQALAISQHETVAVMQQWEKEKRVAQDLAKMATVQEASKKYIQVQTANIQRQVNAEARQQMEATQAKADSLERELLLAKKRDTTCQTTDKLIRDSGTDPKPEVERRDVSVAAEHIAPFAAKEVATSPIEVEQDQESAYHSDFNSITAGSPHHQMLDTVLSPENENGTLGDKEPANSDVDVSIKEEDDDDDIETIEHTEEEDYSSFASSDSNIEEEQHSVQSRNAEFLNMNFRGETDADRKRINREVVPDESFLRDHRSEDDEDSVLADSNGEDYEEGSFRAFTKNLLNNYRRDVETRRNHEHELLKMRERALREKTREQLKWLIHQKKCMLQWIKEKNQGSLSPRSKDIKMPTKRDVEVRLEAEKKKIETVFKMNQASIDGERAALAERFYREKLHHRTQKQLVQKMVNETEMLRMKQQSTLSDFDNERNELLLSLFSSGTNTADIPGIVDGGFSPFSEQSFPSSIQILNTSMNSPEKVALEPPQEGYAIKKTGTNAATCVAPQTPGSVQSVVSDIEVVEADAASCSAPQTPGSIQSVVSEIDMEAANTPGSIQSVVSEIEEEEVSQESIAEDYSREDISNTNEVSPRDKSIKDDDDDMDSYSNEEFEEEDFASNVGHDSTTLPSVLGSSQISTTSHDPARTCLENDESARLGTCAATPTATIQPSVASPTEESAELSGSTKDYEVSIEQRVKKIDMLKDVLEGKKTELSRLRKKVTLRETHMRQKALEAKLEIEISDVDQEIKLMRKNLEGGQLPTEDNEDEDEISYQDSFIVSTSVSKLASLEDSQVYEDSFIVESEGKEDTIKDAVRIEDDDWKETGDRKREGDTMESLDDSAFALSEGCATPAAKSEVSLDTDSFASEPMIQSPEPDEQIQGMLSEIVTDSFASDDEGERGASTHAQVVAESKSYETLKKEKTLLAEDITAMLLPELLQQCMGETQVDQKQVEEQTLPTVQRLDEPTVDEGDDQCGHSEEEDHFPFYDWKAHTEDYIRRLFGLIEEKAGNESFKQWKSDVQINPEHAMTMILDVEFYLELENSENNPEYLQIHNKMIFDLVSVSISEILLGTTISSYVAGKPWVERRTFRSRMPTPSLKELQQLVIRDCLRFETLELDPYERMEQLICMEMHDTDDALLSYDREEWQVIDQVADSILDDLIFDTALHLFE
eukprot:CAMPEP_0203744304 /NCGR_PEP_ID=MMETSP0098-20131031/428_1 /ASSEMBLY_ACC=CAM_ASM_000208 /TAXON_ID=96639 /ORGANISM=" , Strain NY0313808BC1" /LENGTH=1921 /DNA_ID=CAMNT_0050631795 /DNA_START=147 /DNA_END=5912 /DNA_ORIENTATION=+